jgi:2-polyprenyl-3-methyl-5-hydroxy-6-metoxy-1,4-benzoquinol methylase
MQYKITNDQWQEAQKWERNYWDNCIQNAKSVKNLGIFKTVIKKIIGRRTDPNANYWWSKQFDNYAFVPADLQNVVEFGCGHTTNLRLVLRGRQAKHVFASDPLIRHYITYRGSHISKEWRKGTYMIDNHPLEDAPFCSNYFDLVVCINVLDHVRDVSSCMENLIRVVKPHGILIFGQNLTNEEDTKRKEELRKSGQSEIGHPHKFPDENMFLPFFAGFETLIHKVLKQEEGYAPQWNHATLIYAGKKFVV